MLSKKEFWDWFKKEVQVRWKVCHFEWTEMGDWHWRLEKFDLDTLTQAVRQHKAREDWRTPSLKKVYEYAGKIKASNSPPVPSNTEGKRTDDSGVPEAHTFIMCTAKDDNGRGTVGWFVPILVWPFHKTYTATTYQRAAKQQLSMHSRRGGVWEIFTCTDHGKMLKRANRLCDIKPVFRQSTLVI